VSCKKWFYGALIILLAGVFIFTGFSCAQPAPAPSPAPASKPAPAPAPAPTPVPATAPSPKPSPSAAPSGPPPGAAPIKISYLGGMPLKTLVTDGQDKFKEIIEKRSNGVITVELYPAGQLYQHKDIPEAIQNGAASMAVADPNQWSGTCPISMAVQLPMGFDTMAQHQKFLANMAPIFNKELEKMKTLMIGWNYYGAGMGIISKDPIKTVADLNGKKLRGMGEIQEVVFGALGAKVVAMSSAEVYTAMQRGMLDAGYSGMDTFVSRKWMEPFKYVVLPPNNGTFTPIPYPIVWNMDKWKALPAWAQQMVSAVTDEVYKWQLAESDSTDQKNMVTLKENGVTIYSLPAAEYSQWTKAAAVGWKYVAERDKDNGAAMLKAADTARS